MLQRRRIGPWDLAEKQHGVIARAQLLELGLSPDLIKHRIKIGRLHPVFRGVYALGRPELSQYGRWMAAILSCGPKAVLSHLTAAALWEIAGQSRTRSGEPARFGGRTTEGQAATIEVSLPAHLFRRRPGITVHRRTTLAHEDLTERHGIPVTTPACTLIDIAVSLPPRRVEAAINEADKLGLTNPEALRSAVHAIANRPGAAALRQILDRRTFTLTDSELERRFLPIARGAGLPLPETGRRVNGFKVDFFWPAIGLVVETDGLRYHRTPTQQASDRLRDQTHAAAGVTCLRFTHAQVRYEPGHVEATLRAVAGRLGSASSNF